MKIKDFLILNSSDNKVKIYDFSDGLIYTGDIYGAVREYGYYTVREWCVKDSIICVSIRKQF